MKRLKEREHEHSTLKRLYGRQGAGECRAEDLIEQTLAPVERRRSELAAKLLGVGSAYLPNPYFRRVDIPS